MPKNPSTNNAALRALMKRKGLTRARVAQLTMTAEITVDTWLAPAGSTLFRSMPDRALHLLRLELGLAKPQGEGESKK